MSKAKIEPTSEYDELTYVVIAPLTNRIKIGQTTRDAWRRLRHLICQAGQDIQLISLFSGTVHETRLHAMLRNWRCVGEWFTVTEESSKILYDYTAQHAIDPVAAMFHQCVKYGNDFQEMASDPIFDRYRELMFASYCEAVEQVAREISPLSS